MDAEVHLWQATRELAAGLSALEPFGCANPKPTLVSRGVFMNGRSLVGRDQAHFKFEAYDGVASVPAIAFRCPDAASLAANDAAVDVLYSLDTDTWQGRERVQLMVRRIVPHLAPADAPAAELVEELFADAERILARGEYEGIADAESFHTKLAGVSFEGRQDVVARLEPGAVLRVVRQPDNPYDANAIALLDPTGEQVGFFNRRLAAALAPEIDGGVAFDVTVTEVTGGEGGASRGVNVLVSRTARPTEAERDAEARAARRAQLAALDGAGARRRARPRAHRRRHAARRAARGARAPRRGALVPRRDGDRPRQVAHLPAARRPDRAQARAGERVRLPAARARRRPGVPPRGRVRRRWA